MELSTRDKAAIQKVTRYADVMKERRFEFSIRYGVVHFGKPGTTSHAQFGHFHDQQEAEKHVAQLALFAWRRLSRKYGENPAWHMLHPDIHVYLGERGHRLNLRELMTEQGMETSA